MVKAENICWFKLIQSDVDGFVGKLVPWNDFTNRIWLLTVIIPLRGEEDLYL